MNEFKNGRECVQDAHRAGRTVTATDSYNTEHLKRLLKSDRRITCEEMAQELEMCRVSSYYSAQPFEDQKGFG